MYQESKGIRTPIVGAYVIKEDNKIGFHIPDYDRGRPLVIDPIVYTTYIGGSGNEEALSVAADNAGNVYVTGYTESLDFPTAGSGQATSAGKRDAFVAKLNPDGTAALYVTYLGGAEDDTAHSIAIDGAGHAYITGVTASPNFPVTAGAYQALYGGGSSDAFVAVLNPSGALTYSTFLGGSGADSARGIALAPGGPNGARHVLVTGATASFLDWPTTAGALQRQPGGGASDGFVVKLDIASSSLLYSSYLGGSGDDQPIGIAVDSAGSAHITGATNSADFPLVNPLRTNPGGFVAKLAPDGSTLVYSTFLGPSGPASSSGIAVDAAGNAYVAGRQSVGALDMACLTWGGYTMDGFVGKLTATGALAAWNCFALATSGGSGIAVDSVGNYVVAGILPNMGDPWDSPPSLVVFTPYEVVGLADGMYLDTSYLALALDGAGNVYVAGGTSGNFPATAGAMQTTPRGGLDAFVTKIAAPAPPPPPPSSEPLTLVLTSPDGQGVLTSTFNVSWTYTGGAAPIGIQVQAQSLDGWATTPLGIVYPASTPGSLSLNPRNMMQGRQVLTVRASDATGVASQVTREITVWADVTPPDTSITAAVDANGATLSNGGVTLARAITFTVGGSDNTMVARLECRLDATTFAPCTSPITYSSLAIGSHSFEARAVDQAGNVDGTPAQFSVTVVDAPPNTPPNTTITSAVDGRGKSIANGGSTPSDRMTFRFTGTDNGAVTGFECRLDGASFAPCTSPISYLSVSRGTHTFRVRAIDNNGSRDLSPAAFTWQR